MRQTTRLFTVLVAALLVSVFSTGHAHGEYVYDYAPTTWIPADGVPVTLASFPLWRSAGAKLFVNSRLQVDSPNARMLVGVGVRCKPASAPDDDKKDFLVWRTQNIENIPGNNAFVLRARVESSRCLPAAGTRVCYRSRIEIRARWMIRGRAQRIPTTATASTVLVAPG
jgi:hypothetical protein